MGLSALAMLAALDSSVVVTLSTTSCLMASGVMAEVVDVEVLLVGAILSLIDR